MTFLETTPLTEFVRARIAEDEAMAERSIQIGHKGLSLVSIGDPESSPVVLMHPTRVLAECEVKRTLLDHVSSNWRLEEYVAGLIATIYSGHEDYDDKWRP